MKLAEFKALCEKEWRECRGEVVTLWLTQDSYEELSKQSLTAGVSQQNQLTVSPGFEVAAIPSITVIRNPVTKSNVRMRLARDKDAADCFSGNTKRMYTLILDSTCLPV